MYATALSLTGAEYHHNERLRLLGREQLAVQRVADAGERGRRSRHWNALCNTRRPILETKLDALAWATIEDRFGDARLARRPAGPAVKVSIIVRIEAAAATIRHAIAQRALVARRDHDIVVAESITAGVTRMRRLFRRCARHHGQCCGHECNCTEKKR